MFAVRKLMYVCLISGGCLSGCTGSSELPKKDGTSSENAVVTETVRKPARVTSSAVLPNKKVNPPTSKVFEIPREYQTESLETLFSRVLSRGFRQVSKHTNLTRERCIQAMQAVVSRGQTSVSFLGAKMNQGSLSEKALAMWLIGSMGPHAKKLAREVGYAMSRSWTVPIKRCVKAGKEQSACATQIFKTAPSWTVIAGCRALANLGSLRAVREVARLGLSQAMMTPCLSAFSQHVSDGEVRDRLIESWSDDSASEQVVATLSKRPKAALSFAVYWLYSQIASGQFKDCPLTTVLGGPSSPVVKQLKGRLHLQELAALIELRDSSKASGSKTCISEYLDEFGAYDETLPSLPTTPAEPAPTPGQFFDVGEFCPAAR